MESKQAEVRTDKKPYSAPKLSTFGDVRTITGQTGPKGLGVMDLGAQQHMDLPGTGS